MHKFGVSILKLLDALHSDSGVAWAVTTLLLFQEALGLSYYNLVTTMLCGNL